MGPKFGPYKASVALYCWYLSAKMNRSLLLSALLVMMVVAALLPASEGGLVHFVKETGRGIKKAKNAVKDGVTGAINKVKDTAVNSVNAVHNGVDKARNKVAGAIGTH